jgi:transposase
MSDLRDAKDKGFIQHVPHYNSIFNYLENPELMPILKELITQSALPLKSIETDFAVDSTGFMTSRFTRWFDKKYGVVKQEHDWVKAHIMCGVKTNVVTSVDIQGQHTGDSPLLPALVADTARNFQVNEVLADKGYSSVNNLNAVMAINATPYIAFKQHTTGAHRGSTWEKMFHYFSFNREQFFAHYHKRSNIESTVMMIKTKFRDHVRSKTDVAMKNEVLAKILCHNVCCVISAIYELGIDPVFWAQA